MELIDRYLQAVRFWLPRRQQDDIVAELSEDLRAQVEERERELGRPLTESDVEALLRQRGSPILVANGYLPQHSLIGPLLFPLYVFVLKIVSLCIVVSIALSWLVAIVSHAFGAVTARHAPVFSGATFGTLLTALFSTVAVVTLIFAVLERTHAKTEILEKWNPRSLPPLRHPHIVPRSSSAIELAVNLCVVVWWGMTMASPLTLHFGSFSVALAASWVWFFWAILLLTAGSSALALANLLRPWWTPTRTALRILLDVGGSVFFCWLMKANLLVHAVWPGATPERAAAVVDGVNLWLQRAFPAVVALSVAILAANIYRMIRLSRKPRTQAPRPAMI